MVQYGPARTREKSATTRPASGPGCAAGPGPSGVTAGSPGATGRAEGAGVPGPGVPGPGVPGPGSLGLGVLGLGVLGWLMARKASFCPLAGHLSGLILSGL